MMRRLAVWSLCLCALLLGCPAPEPPERADAVVRTTLSGDPASLSLLGKMDLSSELIAFQISDSLVQFDEKLELRPRVAESWELSEDRTRLTFRLRDGVRWHDGRPVTARDVVFTVETVRDPATENRTYGPVFDGLTRIEAVDDRTVVAHYETIRPGFLEAWRVPLIPQHLAGADPDLLTGAFSRHPIRVRPLSLRSLPARAGADARGQRGLLGRGTPDRRAGLPLLPRPVDGPTSR